MENTCCLDENGLSKLASLYDNRIESGAPIFWEAPFFLAFFYTALYI